MDHLKHADDALGGVLVAAVVALEAGAGGVLVDRGGLLGGAM